MATTRTKTGGKNKSFTNESVDVRPPVDLYLKVREDCLARFCLLTGGGFLVDAGNGRCLRDLLCEQLRIPPDYLAKRIQTIFLNGKVVDDPNETLVQPGSTIALSAAMPGIAGAMFRKGSAYAPMRACISQTRHDIDRLEDGQSPLVIKLFNLVQVELGPLMLRDGIRISGRALSSLFRGRTQAFRSGILTAHVGDVPISPQELLERDWQDQDVILHVHS